MGIHNIGITTIISPKYSFNDDMKYQQEDHRLRHRYRQQRCLNLHLCLHVFWWTTIKLNLTLGRRGCRKKRVELLLLLLRIHPLLILQSSRPCSHPPLLRSHFGSSRFVLDEPTVLLHQFSRQPVGGCQ